MSSKQKQCQSNMRGHINLQYQVFKDLKINNIYGKVKEKM